MRWGLVVVSLWLWALPGAGVAQQAAAENGRRNLYEWMALAPIVVTAKVEDDDGRVAQVRLLHVARGGLEAGQTVVVDVRQANRKREEFQKRLRLELNSVYLLLLHAPDSPPKGNRPIAYRLVRGVRGAREVPAEGRELYSQATARFADIQASGSDMLTWIAFERLLEETSPLLIETALQQFLKFQRGTHQLLPVLRPLLDHPQDGVRELAVELAGKILARNRRAEFDDRVALESELIGLARRDPSIAVRATATAALAGIQTAPLDQILEEISGGDPDQLVRYAAERLLYERRLSGESSVGPTAPPEPPAGRN